MCSVCQKQLAINGKSFKKLLPKKIMSKPIDFHEKTKSWLLMELQEQETSCIQRRDFYVTLRIILAQMAKNLPAMQETWVQSLGQEDPLGKEMATLSRTLAWRIPGSGDPDGLRSMGHKESDTTEQLTHTRITLAKNKRQHTAVHSITWG